jgi:hypothetical protein
VVTSSFCPASGGIHYSIFNLQSFREGESNVLEEGAYDKKDISMAIGTIRLFTGPS